MSINRRQFLGALSLSAISACEQSNQNVIYTKRDAETLLIQKRSETAGMQAGSFGGHRYQGYKGLAKLPWFELNPMDELVCVSEDVEGAIDFHAHLGMSVLFARKLNLLQKSDRVAHLLDCDAPDHPCELHLNQYANGNFTERTLKTLETEVRNQGLWGSDFAKTQTIPNLINEMDLMRVQKAVLLPIKLGFWFGDNLTEDWRDAIIKSKTEQRLVAGFSIHPLKSGWEEAMTRHAENGHRIMKLHPTVQRFYPDDPKLMPIYELAEALKVCVFFHGGRAGIEPESSHRFAMPRHYIDPIKNFPNVNFILGHAGARDFKAMLKIGIAHNNAWLGIHGQSLDNLEQMIQETNGERLLFGSDWPFYHIGMSLAKVLITTDSPARAKIRSDILKNNANRLFQALY